jgi:hypothetical protein
MRGDFINMCVECERFGDILSIDYGNERVVQ